MSAATVLAKMRLILGDQGETFQARLVGDGETTQFELPVMFIDTTSFSAFKLDPTLNLVTPTDYVLDHRIGNILLTSPLEEDRVLVVQGVHFQEFAPEDLLTFLQSALAKHTVNREPLPSLDPVPGGLAFSEAEEGIIAIRGVIEALWSLATDAAMDENIQTPDGVSIPRGQRFQQIMQLIQYWEAEYSHLAQALNVGIHRIEMFDLRRVSRTTNRLVPLYKPREYDDRKPPQRVLVPIDNKGGTVITYKGGYVSTVDYARNDIVDLLQTRYIAKQPNGPATTLVTPGTDLSVWEPSTINTGWSHY